MEITLIISYLKYSGGDFYQGIQKSGQDCIRISFTDRGSIYVSCFMLQFIQQNGGGKNNACEHSYKRKESLGERFGK